MPLTLATAQALLFESSGYALAVPLSSVVRARFVDLYSCAEREDSGRAFLDAGLECPVATPECQDLLLQRGE